MRRVKSLLKLFIAGPHEFTNECGRQVERSDMEIQVVDTVTRPETVVDALEEHISNTDAILLGFPDEIINQFIEVINRHAVTATTFVSVDNLAVGYKTWTPYRFKCTRRNQEIQTITNYFRSKPELLRQPVVTEPATIKDTAVNENIWPGFMKNKISLADIFTNLSVKFKPTERDKTKHITINSPLDKNKTFTAVILSHGHVEEDIRKAEVIFVPASWGTNRVQQLRRKLGNRAVLIIVIGGGIEFLYAGADKVVKRITKNVVEEAGVLAQRLQDLWLHAETDPLTGCYTRGFWDSWLDEQHLTEKPYAVALIDLDHFKSVNDIYGHQAGDTVLRSFGEFLRKSTRSGDVVARYGGEEFAIGLPYASAQSAKVVVDHLLQKWSNQSVVNSSGDSITCSFSAGTADSNHDNVMAEADQMLYKAKHAGRNRVQEAQSTAPKPKRVPYLTSPVTDTLITITSPWISGCGVTTLVMEAVRHLLEKGYTVGLVDANTKRPGVSRLLEIPDEVMWEHDWRTGGIKAGIAKDRLLVWLLDPLRHDRADVGDFRNLIDEASALSDYLIIDGGSEPDSGLLVGHTLLMVAPRVKLPEITRAWNHFCPSVKGSLVLTGKCDDVSGFGLPVAGLVKSPADWRKLLDNMLLEQERRELHA